MTSKTRATTYGYDDATHGNLVSLKRHLDTSGQDLETIYTYTANGMLHTEKLPADAVTPNTATTYEYSSTYQGAVPTGITDAMNHATTITYDLANLNTLSVVDPNGQSTGYEYYGDGRLHNINYPDGGQTSYAYPSPTEVDTTIKLDAGSKVTSTSFDGLGRKVQTALLGECQNSGSANTETTYDLMNRIRSVANLHCPSDTIYKTYYGDGSGTSLGYDALGRPTLVTNPDTTTRAFHYNDRSADTTQDSVRITDEAANATFQISDALGHLVGVQEPGNLHTGYTQDSFGDLTGVNQQGLTGEQSKNRGFVYDSLGRLSSSNNPETGKISYTYDNHGNLNSKTDARGVKINYSYDALNRLTAKNVAGGGSLGAFGYDGKDENGGPVPGSTNAIGRISRVSAPGSPYFGFGYDAMGRLQQKSFCMPPTCVETDKIVRAEYNLEGDLTKMLYPDGRVVQQTRDLVGRVSGVAYVGWNGLQKNASYFDASGAGSYDASGHLVGGAFGNGVGMVAGYDQRQRLGTLAYGTVSQLLWGRNYGWTPNSNMANWTDILSGAQRQFGYDPLSRLTSAVDFFSTSSGSAQPSVPAGSSVQVTVRFTNDSCSACASQPPYQDRDLYVQSVRVGGQQIATSSSDWSYSNCNAGNGHLQCSGDLTATFNAIGPVTVTAYGTPDGGTNAHMQVLVNGSLVGECDVTTDSTSYTTSSSSSYSPNTSATPAGTPAQWTDPDNSNLLDDADTPGGDGWRSGPVRPTITFGALAPDGGNSAYTVVSGDSDGFIAARANTQGLYDKESLTGSVWLRAPNGSQTINLYLVQSSSTAFQVPAAKQITLTQSWQQYQVTGQFQLGYDYSFQIAGGGSLTNGQSIQMWGTKLEDTGNSGRTVTNYLPYSQRMTGTSWAPANASIADNASAPDGTNTASTLTSTASDGFIAQTMPNPAPFAGASLTASVWLRAPSGSVGIPIFIIVIDANGFSACGRERVNLTSDWTRFTVSCQTSSSLNLLAFQVGGESSLQSGASIQIWGAQLELASSAGPYVATGATAASIGTNLTNLLPYSSQMDGPSWTPSGMSTVVNAVTAPDGTKTGMEMTALSGSSDAHITADTQHPPFYDGVQATGSVFLRSPGGPSTIFLYLIGQNASGWIPFASPQTVSVGTEWTRVSVTRTLATGLNRFWFQVGGGGSFANGQRIDIWGAQIELAGSPGMYVATNGLPVLSGQELRNLLGVSQQENGPAWAVNQGATAVNSATAPDGSSTASTVTANQNANDSYVLALVPNPSLYDGQTVTGSVHLRAPSGSLNLSMFLPNTAGNTSSSGTSFQAPSQQITVTSSWQRYFVTGTLQNGLISAYLQIGGASTFAHGQAIQIWGAQFTLGSSPMPYTPVASTAPQPNNGQAALVVPNGMNAQYSYDSFGNLTRYENFQSTYNERNQRNGWPYDAAGNLLTTNYLGEVTWDAESRVSSAGGATYLYDAEGNRVRSSGSSVTDTFYFGGRPIARLQNGQWTDLIYGPQGLIAEVAGQEAAEPQYRLTDPLGTLVGNLGKNNSGQPILTNAMDYSPFGRAFAGNTPDPYFFTGKERDAESGLDYFGARYYASSMGRWMSPDWADKPEAVPYSDLENPQSLNLYNYVNNNPLSKADKDGHCLEDVCVVEGVAAVAVVALTASVYLSMPSTQRSLSAAGSQAISAVSSWFHKSDSKPAPAAPAEGEKPGEPPQLAGGREAHNNEEVRPGEKAEFPTPSKRGRMDRYDADKAHIREIKPDNPRGEKSGQKQLGRYKAEMEKATGRSHTTELTKYPPPTPKP